MAKAKTKTARERKKQQKRDVKQEASPHRAKPSVRNDHTEKPRRHKMGAVARIDESRVRRDRNISQANELDILLKEWLWVKDLTELCDQVRSQFDVSAERCSALLMGPRNFREELEAIWSEIIEKQRAILTERLEHPSEAELELIGSPMEEERIFIAMESLRQLAANGDVSAKEVLVTCLVTFPQLGKPEDTGYPFSLNLKATGNLAEGLDARRNMLFSHELRRQFLVAVGRSLYLDPTAPAWPEHPAENTLSLFLVNIGSSALLAQTRWYAGCVKTVRRSRCILNASHWFGENKSIIPQEVSLDVPFNAFVTRAQASTP